MCRFEKKIEKEVKLCYLQAKRARRYDFFTEKELLNTGYQIFTPSSKSISHTINNTEYNANNLRRSSCFQKF